MSTMAGVVCDMPPGDVNGKTLGGGVINVSRQMGGVYGPSDGGVGIHN